MSNPAGIVYLDQLSDDQRFNYERGQEYVDAKRLGAVAYGITVDDWKSGNLAIRCIYVPSEYDRDFYGQYAYRWDSLNIRGTLIPIVKIKAKTQMIYFTVDNDSEETEFETRGTKWQYLVVIDQDKFLESQSKIK